MRVHTKEDVDADEEISLTHSRSLLELENGGRGVPRGVNDNRPEVRQGPTGDNDPARYSDTFFLDVFSDRDWRTSRTTNSTLHLPPPSNNQSI